VTTFGYTMMCEQSQPDQLVRDVQKAEAVGFGRHFEVAQARLWDLPSERVPIGLAVSGESSCRLAGHKADIMIAVEPKAELVQMFEQHGGQGRPKVGQVPLAYDTDREAAVTRAHEQFRWFGLGWTVNADLPNPEGFDAATRFVTPDDVAGALGCGSDVDEHVEKIKPFIDAGFDEIALVQIGSDHQDAFIDWAEKELLPALRSL
jgi:G6PDH family F420-dependent oxidoreductase